MIDQSSLTVLVIGRKPNEDSIGRHAVEIEARIGELASLFSARCHIGELPVYGIASIDAFKAALLDFLRDSGQIHYVLDASSHPTTVIAAATVQLSYSPLRSHFPIEDFLVDEALPSERRHAATDLLLQSIRSQAGAEAKRRSKRIMLSFLGSRHGPTFEHHGFVAMHHGNVTLWGLPVHPAAALRAVA